MIKSDKVGGFAAFSLVLIYIIGIVMNASILDTSKIVSSVELVHFLKDNQTLMYVWITLLYVVFGIVLVALSLAVYEKLKAKSEFGAKVTTAFGLIWSCLVIASGMVHNVGMSMAIEMLEHNPEGAGRFFEFINAIHIGLGGGNEIPGAIWTLLISLIAMQYGLFRKWINVIGVVVGVAGVLTIIPTLFDYTVMVFALGQMIWWVGIGRTLLKGEVA